MTETIRIENGTLTWCDQVIEGISFQIEIEKDASVSILFDPLIYDSSETRREGMRIFGILQEIQLKRSRRVAKFDLSGRSTGGIEVATSHARLANDSKYTIGSTITLNLVATADELVFAYPAAADECDEIDACVEYLTPGQLGGVGCDTVELPIGILSFSATTGTSNASKYYGALCVEQRVSRADLNQWLEACDEVAERALHLLSLAQGRWFNWSARIVYRQLEDSSEKLYRCVRPREQRPAIRIHLFHHLALGEPLELLKTTYTRDLIDNTGIDTALLLMLTSTTYTEGRMWNQLVALEHLLTKFSEKYKVRLIRSKVYNKQIKPQLLDVLDRAVAEGLVPAGKAEGEESEEYQTFKGKIEMLNLPTLYMLFLEFVDYYQIPVDDLDADDLKSLVLHCRNDLAHQGVLVRIGKDRDRLHYLVDFAEELLNRVVMTMLGYEGQYISSLHMLEHYHFSKEGVRPLNPPSRAEKAQQARAEH